MQEIYAKFTLWKKVFAISIENNLIICTEVKFYQQSNETKSPVCTLDTRKHWKEKMILRLARTLKSQILLGKSERQVTI